MKPRYGLTNNLIYEKEGITNQISKDHSINGNGTLVSYLGKKKRLKSCYEPHTVINSRDIKKHFKK